MDSTSQSPSVERPPRLSRLFRSCFLGLLMLSVCLLVVYLVPSSFLQTPGAALKGYYYNLWTNGTRALLLASNQTADPRGDPTTAPPPPAVRYHVAYARNYRFVMDEPEACRGGRAPFLVLMVPVAPNNPAARDAIRKTWGGLTLVQEKPVRTFFMLGLPGGGDAPQQQECVQEESRTHRDLIQSDFMDTYHNLTIKTMVILDWLATRCPGASYAMKVDSDMFLNVQNLVSMLLTPGLPTTNYLTGMLMWNRPVLRDKNSKWYVSEEMFPESTYPTYPLGMGYVLSNDLPEKLVEVGKGVKPFNIEDAYVGMCMVKLGLGPTGPPNPSQWKSYLQNYNRCEFSTVITYILSTAAQLVDYWTDLHKPGPPC